MTHSEIVRFFWGVADLIRDTFKRGKYQGVILPPTVLRRLDCVLAPTKAKVLAKQSELRGKKLENLDPQFRRASGFAYRGHALPGQTPESLLAAFDREYLKALGGPA